MNEQNDHIWMHKKPETVFDWLAIIAISIALYLMLGHLNVFAGGIAKFLDVVAPFASGIVIAYVLDCIVRPVQRYVMKENPKLRWLSILIAYIVAALIITLLVSMGSAGRSFPALPCCSPTCRCTYPMCRTCWICCKTVMALI